MQKMDELRVEDAALILRETLVQHATEVNFPSADFCLIEALLAHDSYDDIVDVETAQTESLPTET